VSGLKLHGPMDVRITVGSGRRGRHGAAKALCKSKNVASCVASIKTPASGRATPPAPVNLHVSIIAPHRAAAAPTVPTNVGRMIMLNCFGCPLPQRTAAEDRGSLICNTVNARHARRKLGAGRK
jgi:hypothetical protein